MIIVSFSDVEIWGDGSMNIISKRVNKKYSKNEKLVENMIERYNDLTERIRFKKELINDKEKSEKCLKAFDWYAKTYQLTAAEQHCYNFVKYWSKQYK